MDKCPTVELGVFTTHLKKKRRKRDSPCSLPIKDQERRRDSNMRNSEQ
jgi:hypothetical protein